MNTELPVVSEVVKLPELSAEEAEKQFPGPSEFVHLHNHTLFSLLDGVAHPGDYFKGCAERKWPAFAVTEHGVMSSVPDAYLAAKEHKVKYIPGCEFYFSDYEGVRKKLADEKTKVKEWSNNYRPLADRIFRNRHLTVLAKNYKGYENLLHLNRIAYKEAFYRKPRISMAMLEQFKEGLIVTSGCLNSPVSHELRSSHINTKDNLTWGDGVMESSFVKGMIGREVMGAYEYLKEFKRIFGDDFYMELQMPGIPNDVEIFRKLVSLASYMKIKPIICNDCHYLNRKDFELQKVMMAIDQGEMVDSPDLFHVNSSEQYFKTRHELRATFNRGGYAAVVSADVFEAACNNTLEIADKCQTFKPNLDPKLPNIEDADNKLTKLVYEGLKTKKLGQDTGQYIYDEKLVTYKEQVEIELERIIEKGFASYFLITLDLIKSSTDKGWPIGPGRGSVGGSLISYLIGIHGLDPIKWNLSYNRFLSPSRGGYMLNVGLPK